MSMLREVASSRQRKHPSHVATYYEREMVITEIKITEEPTFIPWSICFTSSKNTGAKI